MPKISNVFLLEFPDQNVIQVTKVLPMNKIADFIMRGYETLDPYLHGMGELTTDIPFIIYRNWKKMYTDEIEVSLAYPTLNKLPGNDEIESAVYPGGKYAVCYYRGNYKQMGNVYDTMEKWAAGKGLELLPDCYEFYYNGDDFTEEDFLTKVYFPVKA